MTNLSWSVLSGALRSAASFLRCASSDALNAAAEPNRFAMASLPLDSRRGQRCSPRAALEPVRPRGVADRLDELALRTRPRARASATAFSSCSWLVVAGRDVEERPERGRDPEPDPLLDLRGAEDRLVEDAARAGGSFRNPGGTVRWISVRQELRQLVEDQGRLVGDDRLGLVRAVPAPEREPDEVVVLGQRHVGEPVEPVLDPLELPGRDVVVEVRVVVTRCLRLLCGEIAALLLGRDSERPRGFSCTSGACEILQIS